MVKLLNANVMFGRSKENTNYSNHLAERAQQDNELQHQWNDYTAKCQQPFQPLRPATETNANRPLQVKTEDHDTLFEFISREEWQRLQQTLSADPHGARLVSEKLADIEQRLARRASMPPALQSLYSRTLLTGTVDFARQIAGIHWLT